MKCLALTLALLASAAVAQPVPPGASDAQDVVATTQRFFDALAARDSTALVELLHPGAQVVSVSPDGRVNTEPAWAWIHGVASWTGPALRERMHDPRVDVDGPLAALWARYDFHIGDDFSHCGTDAFQFVRDGPRWRLLTVTFTVQTEGCPSPP